ncbi:MAG: transposase, partial [Spirochaetota bacterium]
MHKNSQKRYYIKGAIYFTTTVTKKRYPYFKENIFGQILQEQIHVAQQMLHFHLYAYAIMSEHVHILMMPNDGCNYSKIMQFIKRHFTRNVNFVMGYSSHECAMMYPH